MKTCVSSYSFGSYISQENPGIIGVIDKVKEMGFDGIEFCIGDWANNYDIETARRLNEYVKKAGLDLVSMTTGADFINGSNGNLKDEIEKLYKAVDFAAMLGVKNMRHDASNGIRGRHYSIGFDDALPIIVEGCREVTKYAEQKGVGTMVENHGFFMQGSYRHEKLINAVAHPNFGALVDIGNYMCSDEDPAFAAGVMAPYTFHVHVKDFHFKPGTEVYPGSGWFMSRAGNYLRGAIVGHGEAHVAQSLRALRNNGYNGHVSIEFEGMEDNLLGIRIGLENIKRFIV
ncbi:MAG: sugar phosphate isomerase/epimerase [Oscillospiraceae bacterium]|nr:sugar phosphate isomerase/epimerase [Oscillospiraceae bacterium]